MQALPIMKFIDVTLELSLWFVRGLNLVAAVSDQGNLVCMNVYFSYIHTLCMYNTCTCVCVCVHVCTYIRMQVRTYVCMYTCL